MKEELKYIIIDALTSGEYKQGTGRLKMNDKYCCLGVITDLYNKMTQKGQWTKEDQFETPTRQYIGVLGYEIREWSGIPTEDGNYGDGCRSLINDNDHGKSFLEIAEIIEENF